MDNRFPYWVSFLDNNDEYALNICFQTEISVKVENLRVILFTEHIYIFHVYHVINIISYEH